MKNIILAISVIIGTLIGAGFASGKEIEIFFCQYGGYGLLGIVLSACLMGLIIYGVLRMIEKYSIQNYDEFLDRITVIPFKQNRKSSNSYWIKSIIKNIINLFLLLSFFIMIAGFGSYFEQEFSLPSIVGAILLSFLCYVTFQKGIQGITKISSILIPILIGFILILGLQKGMPVVIPSIEFSGKSYGWIWQAILYGSYNTILVIPILFSLKEYTKNKKTSKILCMLIVFIIWLLATIIYGEVIEICEKRIKVEIPMLYQMGKKGSIYQYLYGILILISIYTSAISAGYGFLKNAVRKTQQKIGSMLICIIGATVSLMGFSSLVELLYPVFGVVGLLQIYGILKCLKST